MFTDQQNFLPSYSNVILLGGFHKVMSGKKLVSLVAETVTTTASSSKRSKKGGLLCFPCLGSVGLKPYCIFNSLTQSPTMIYQNYTSNWPYTKKDCEQWSTFAIYIPISTAIKCLKENKQASRMFN